MLPAIALPETAYCQADLLGGFHLPDKNIKGNLCGKWLGDVCAAAGRMAQSDSRAADVQGASRTLRLIVYF